jgi:hypothetical protein
MGMISPVSEIGLERVRMGVGQVENLASSPGGRDFKEVMGQMLDSLNQSPKIPHEMKSIPNEMKSLLEFQRQSHEIGLRVEMVTKIAEAGASSLRRLSQS